VVAFTLPLHLASAGNARHAHWRQRHRATKKLRGSVALIARAYGVRPIVGPVVVRLTRVAPRPLDGHDNLRAAFKACVDQLTAEMGLTTDADARVEWRYEQARGPSAVRVEIEDVANGSATRRNG
jgi:hypothetical protein